MRLLAKVSKECYNVRMKEEIIKEEISKLVVEGRKNLYYPMILSEDPVIAANSLTMEDEQKVLKLLTETYDDLGSKKQQHLALERTILFSKFNFDWFVSYFSELNRLNDLTYKDIPYSVADRIKKGDELFLFPPLKFSNGIVVPNLFKGSTNLNPVAQFRIKYVSEAHEAEEFRDGFPSWYVLSNTTVFEKYSTKTGVRARIDFQNGEFHYFLAGASDNWKQIVGVPLEMDDVITTLLFKD